MSDYKKRFLSCMAFIFITTLILVTIVNIYELHVLGKSEGDVLFFATLMIVKIVILFVAAILLTSSILRLFHKEINFDYMTGLCSRRKLFFDLNKLICEKATFTLCYIDFDNFKHINDAYGHAAGDFLLKEFASRISAIDPKVVTGYRLGGDEFAIIIKCKKDTDCFISAIRKVTKKEIKLVSGDLIKFGFSLGIVENDFVSTADQLLERADSKMYKNKRA